MFKLTKKEEIKLTPKLAADLLDINTYPGQRNFNMNHVEKLKRAYDEGRWTWATIKVARCKYNGNKEVLANGQHTCLASLKYNMNFPVYFQTYLCESEEDLKALFQSIDQGRPRGLADLIKYECQALGINWAWGIPNLVVGAAASIEDPAQRLDADQKANLLPKYIKQGNFVNDILSNLPKGISAKHMKRKPVIKAMILTFNKAQDDAREFWLNVRNGEGLISEQPEYKLRDYLQQIGVNLGRGACSYRRPAPPREITSKCIVAWNAYRQGKSTNLAYHGSAVTVK